MAADDSVRILSLPASTLDRVSQPAVSDAVAYFAPDLVCVPGPRSPTAYAAARDAAACPVVHPQLGRVGDAVQHYRYTAADGVREASETPPGGVDVLAVQRRDVLERLHVELTSGDRSTGTDAATFLVVPQLAVEWDATRLSAELPGAHRLAAVASSLPEPVTVLAGGQPATYSHEWEFRDGDATVTLPVAGLGATEREGTQFTQYTCTPQAAVAAEAVAADEFGLRALHGVGATTARRLRAAGCRTPEDVRDVGVSDLTALPGIGRTTAERIHAHAEVIESGDPLVLTNKTPVKSRDGRPPLCLDIETDGLSPTIIWQFGVYDPTTDTHRAFTETDDPRNPASVLEAFVTWLLANHGDRSLLTWNGYGFDYRYIRQFLRQYRPEYLDAWDDCWTYDLYKWAVRDGNALLPGRTNKLDHVARALGYDAADTGLTGAQTAAAYQRFMRAPETNEPDWERHERYCEEDCRALWHVYERIVEAPRRDVTDSGSGGATGTQAGLTDF